MRTLALILLSLAVLGSLPIPPPAAGPIFVDAAPAAGISFVYDNGGTGELHLPEVMGGGAALFDMDGDGDLDAFLVQGARLGKDGVSPGVGDRLLRNDLEIHPDGDGRRELRFTDVTAESGLGASGYGMGVAAGDYDGDGRTDLYVTRFGENRLLRNLGGGRFEDTTARAGVADPGWSVGAAFLDVDRDGRLDLFVAHYVEYPLREPVRCFATSSRPDYCGPQAFRPQRDRLFRNLGDGRFADATHLLAPNAPAAGLGVLTGDFDGDGWVDVYVANDGDPNHLWISQQGRGFRDEAPLAGVAVNRAGLPEAGMGVDAGDVDGDLDLDLFVTNLTGETNTLYVNLGGGLFEDRTLASGLGPPSRPWTGFGTAFLDYDNDGLLDVVVANGAVRLPAEPTTEPFPLGQPGLLFRGLGTGRFEDVSAAAGPEFARRDVGRGLAVGDVDEDGDPDVLLVNVNGPARLLVNQVGQRAPWLGLRLVDGKGRDAPGAIAVLRRSGAPGLVRRAHTDGSYASASDPRVLFGLGGGGEVRGIEVVWPAGHRESFPAPPAGRYTTLRQGSGRPVAAEGASLPSPRPGEGGTSPSPGGATARSPGRQPREEGPRMFQPRRGGGSFGLRERASVAASGLRFVLAQGPGAGAPGYAPSPLRGEKVASADDPRPHAAASAPQAASTSPPQAASTSPPPALAPVPFPARDGLEPAVAQQLAELEARLRARLREGSADAALFGEAGEVYHAYGLAAAAEACYGNAAALAPGELRWPYLLGVLLEDEDRLEPAAASFERALSGEAMYYPGLLRLAGAYLALGRVEDAAAVLEPARRHAPGDPALLAALGELALAQGRHAEAVPLLTEALRAQPAATRLHQPLAMAFRAAGDLESARRHLALAGEAGIAPRDPVLDQAMARRRGGVAHLLDGRKAFAAGDVAGAAAAFRRALAEAPASVPALVNLAAAETRLGETGAALDHLNRALELDPGNAAARFNLGTLLRSLGRPAEAVPHLREVVSRTPKDDQARLELALALAAAGQAAEALGELESLGRPEPGRCADLAAVLAAIQEKAEEPLAARARALWERLRGAGGCPE